MSAEERLYYRKLLINILNDINEIESESCDNFIPEIKQLALLSKKIEYKKLMIKLAIIENKSKGYINELENEVVTEYKKLIALQNALGYNNIPPITKKLD